MINLPHTRTVFDADLHDLMRMVAEMGGLVEQQIAHAFDALAQKNAALAYQVINRDSAIDALQSEIEDKAINIIAQRQPLAIDLREIISALHISNDLERIGDLAKNISKRTIAIEDATMPTSLISGFEHMTHMVMGQFKTALDSYVQRDVDKALAVRNGDLEIDAFNNALFHETMVYMNEDPENLVASTQILFCVKNLERIGDHSTNIAEAVHYIICGYVPESERPKGDTTNFYPLNA